MKWLERDFILDGQLFTMVGLEISYSKEKIMKIFTAITPGVSTAVRNQLVFDFAFMTGVYPGIAALCMMARCKVKGTTMKTILTVAAILQVLAFSCDIRENMYLLRWLNQPVIGQEFIYYHIVVVVKWSIALLAAGMAIPIALKKMPG